MAQLVRIKDSNINLYRDRNTMSEIVTTLEKDEIVEKFYTEVIGSNSWVNVKSDSGKGYLMNPDLFIFMKCQLLQSDVDVFVSPDMSLKVSSLVNSDLFTIIDEITQNGSKCLFIKYGNMKTGWINGNAHYTIFEREAYLPFSIKHKDTKVSLRGILTIVMFYIGVFILYLLLVAIRIPYSFQTAIMIPVIIGTLYYHKEWKKREIKRNSKK